MSSNAPHHPAAFINAIAEEGTKAEAIEYLQQTWNELCELKKQLKPVSADVMGALHELVQLKKTKDRYGNCLKTDNTFIAEDYRKRKIAAWDTAMTIVDATGECHE